MKNTELAEFIAEFVMAEKETILNAYAENDKNIVEDEAYEYIDQCE
jgi:hypothetical protein